MQSKKTDLLKLSQKQEARTANTYKGSKQPGSGAGWARKNDVRSHQFLFENKLTTGTKSYTFKAADMIELTERALEEDRIPVMQVDIGKRRYIILNEDDFLELIDNE